jgi:O-antigen/teichoic acid export membrane protein
LSTDAQAPVTRRILKESLLYLIASLASRGVGFIMVPVYSRFLSVGEYGTVEVIELTTQVVALVIGLGLFGSSLMRIYQDYDDEHGRFGISSTAILGSAGANLLAGLITIAGASLASQLVFHHTNYTGLLRATFAAMIFSNIEAVCLVYLRLRRRAVFFVVYSLITLTVTLGFNILFIAVQHRGVWGFVLSKLIVSAAGTIFLLFVCLRETRLRWDRAGAVSLVRFGAPLVIANLSYFLLHFGDRFFLTKYSTLDEIGRYSLAYRFAFLVSFIVGEPFSRSWNVAFYDYLKQPGWRDQLRRASLYLASALAAVSLLICLFADEFLHYLVPESYQGALLVLPLLVAAYAVRELGDFFRTLLMVNKRSGIIGSSSVAAALINTLLNFLWIPQHGIQGAAWATFTTWGLMAVAMCWLSSRELETRFPLAGFAAFSGLGLAAFYASSFFARLMPVPALFVADSVLFLAYGAVIWFSGILPDEEKEFVTRHLRSAREKVSELLGGGTAQ